MILKQFTDNGRLVFLDIAKGFLIYLVVLGHLPSDNPLYHRYIFWFHMLVFLMISGIFLKSKSDFKTEISKKIKRLLIPYFFFSLILGTIGRSGDFIKQALGTIWGGYGNVTIYTFPYYFIVVLFGSVCLWYSINNLKVNNLCKWAIAIVLYSIFHVLSLLVPHAFLERIPWNLDMSLNALLYLMLGKYIVKKKLYNNIKWVFGSIFIVVLFYIFDYKGIYKYDFDLKYHNWTFLLDIIIPVSCMLLLFSISRLISKIPYISSLISYIGKGSLTVLLLHPLFIKIYQNVFSDTNLFLLSFINVLSCMFVYYLLCKNKYSRYVIGEK